MANPLYGQNKLDGQIDNSTGKIIHFTPAEDGTGIPDAESLVLTAADAGNRYFINIADYTCSIKLPSAYISKGAEFHFHLDLASDTEASKDLDIFTNSATEFILVCGLDAGAVHDTTEADDLLRIDTTAGEAVAGDRISLVCDGQHWYVTDAVAVSANAFVSGTISRS